MDLTGLQAEELLVTAVDPTTITIRVLSDDGDEACKKAPVDQRTFRATKLQLAI